MGIILIVFMLLGYFLWRVRSGLYPFILAFFLAYLLNPAVCYLENHGLKRVWAIAVVYVVLFSIVIIGGSRLIPLLIREIEAFGRDFPAIVARVEELVQVLQWQYQNSMLPYSLRQALDKTLLLMQGEVQAFVSGLVGGIITLLSHFIGLAITPILSFYILHDWHEIKERLLFLLPPHWRHEAVMILRDVDKVLAGVIRGQITVAIIVGLLVSLGLYLLNVRYALMIGIIAGILDVIPYFGAVIGASPAVTLALLESPWLALKVGVLFLVIHQLEGTVIGPKVLGENVGLHPLSVIFALFVGGELAGLAGMLLGVPVAALAKVFGRHLVRILG
ncbi:sporulation integral membrane protein YtvI [Sporolituus thermophilus DSM 23256]|uniref:Sporulation integral membrane protein YtvI n=1 Tax=Sporolituus thermophilus DSM 23256 TaxID=1123285 RepID=A0A1G7IDN9_9FIRM|nr:sporulation integral membrane protein YtvI [Sporolituus thermophilus DSM 23256]